MTPEITGIFQGDVILRAALLEGIADLRRNPYLLDYIFASLPKDALTAKKYGTQEVAQAKKWFQATEIVVFQSVRLDKPKFPCISVSMVGESEAENTIADVHYLPQDTDSEEWPALTPAFSPMSYVASTGCMVLPSETTSDLIVAPGMVVVDDNNVPHTIVEVDDRNTIFLDANTVAPFTKAVIKGETPSRIVTIESVREKEIFEVDFSVQGLCLWEPAVAL